MPLLRFLVFIGFIGLIACEDPPPAAPAPPAPAPDTAQASAPGADTADSQASGAAEEMPFVKREGTPVVEKLDRLANSLPRQVFALMVLESAPLTEAFLSASSGLFLDNLDKEALTGDLTTLMKAHLGLEIGEDTRLVIAIGSAGWVGLFSEGELVTPQKATPEQVGSLTTLRIRNESLYRIKLEDVGVTGIFFNRADVEALDRARTEPATQSLAGTPQLATLKTLMGHTGLGDITIAGAFHDPVVAQRLFRRLPIDPLDGIGIAFGGRILAAATGSEKSLGQVRSLFTLGKIQMKTRLNRRIRQLPDAPFYEAMGTVLGFHLLNAWSSALHPKMNDGALQLDMPGLETFESMALAGLFAAVVLPTLIERPE